MWCRGRGCPRAGRWSRGQRGHRCDIDSYLRFVCFAVNDFFFEKTDLLAFGIFYSKKKKKWRQFRRRCVTLMRHHVMSTIQMTWRLFFLLVLTTCAIGTPEERWRALVSSLQQGGAILEADLVLADFPGTGRGMDFHCSGLLGLSLSKYVLVLFFQGLHPASPWHHIHNCFNYLPHWLSRPVAPT